MLKITSFKGFIFGPISIKVKLPLMQQPVTISIHKLTFLKYSISLPRGVDDNGMEILLVLL